MPLPQKSTMLEHPEVLSMQFEHVSSPPEKYELYFAQSLATEPKLVPSHCSPESMTPLPHADLGIHSETSNLHFCEDVAGLHLSVPPAYPKDWHVNPPRVPSHSSFLPSWPSPQTEVVVSPPQLLRVSLHPVQLAEPESVCGAME
jgi:hypothetical protein